VPRARDGTEDRAKQAGEQPAPGEQGVERIIPNRLAIADPDERRPDAAQDEKIGDADEQQEDRRDHRADGATNVTPGSEAALQSGCRYGDRYGGKHDDGGVAKREEEADGMRCLVLLHQLADDIVDGSDVIGIERVPQSEDVGKQRDAEQRRPIRERDPCPAPGGEIADQQHAVGRRHLGHATERPVVERIERHGYSAL